LIRRILKKITGSASSGNMNPFHNYPFGTEPRAEKDTYLSIWEEAKKKEYPIIDGFEEASGFSIAEEWLHELALHTQVVVKESEICYQHGRLLYAALSNYLHKNNCDSVNILETGTARGFSSLCMAKALQDREKEGKIVTLDPLPHNERMYWNCIDDLEGAKSRVELLANYSDLVSQYVLFLEGKSKDTLDKLELSRIHFAFLDGGHDYEDVKSEVCYVRQRQEKEDIIFFDDYQQEYFPGIVKAVGELESDGSHHINIVVASDQRGYAIAEKL
jgi:predicted O-methyltransferase YrrM